MRFLEALPTTFGLADMFHRLIVLHTHVLAQQCLTLECLAAALPFADLKLESSRGGRQVRWVKG